MHQKLHLQHHRHTGKVLHHRHTSYHGLLVVFVLAGALMLGLSALNHAAAATFGIAATVAVPVPTSAPVIAKPAAGSSVQDSSALIVGSCPLVTPQVVVTITVDGTPAGTGACDSNNDFSVPVNIRSGLHRIVAGSVTITGQNGPSGNPVLFTSTANMAAAVPISSDSAFIYADGRNITWTGAIGKSSQSTKTYVHIDWGDNNQSNYEVTAGPQSFSHQYASLASHNVLVSASTSAGASSSEQFAEAGYSTASFPQAAAPVVPYSNSGTVIGLYGLYLSALSVTVIIWMEARHAARQHIQLHSATF